MVLGAKRASVLFGGWDLSVEDDSKHFWIFFKKSHLWGKELF